MRHRVVLTGLGSLVLTLLAACGNGNAGNSAGTVTSTGIVSPPPSSAPRVPTSIAEPATAPHGPAVPQSQVDASDVAQGSSRQVWMSDGGRTLGTLTEQTGCATVSGEVDEQSANQVVMVLVTHDSGAGRVCPMIVRNVPVVVHLDAPLGTRTVVLRSREERKR